jgi:hypothetical protein
MMRSPCSGLGVMDPAFCAYAETVTPELGANLYSIPSLPAIVTKPDQVRLTGPAGAGQGDDSFSLGSILQTVNCWVSEHPILAGAGLIAVYLLARQGKRKGTK